MENEMTNKQGAIIIAIELFLGIAAAVFIYFQVQNLNASMWRMGCVDGGLSPSVCEKLEKERHKGD